MIALERVSALIEIQSGGVRQLFEQSAISIVTASSLGEQSLVLVVLCVLIATDKNLRSGSSENELARGVRRRGRTGVSIKLV